MWWLRCEAKVTNSPVVWYLDLLYCRWHAAVQRHHCPDRPTATVAAVSQQIQLAFPRWRRSAVGMTHCDMMKLCTHTPDSIWALRDRVPRIIQRHVNSRRLPTASSFVYFLLSDSASSHTECILLHTDVCLLLPDTNICHVNTAILYVSLEKLALPDKCWLDDESEEQQCLPKMFSRH